MFYCIFAYAYIHIILHFCICQHILLYFAYAYIFYCILHMPTYFIVFCIYRTYFTVILHIYANIFFLYFVYTYIFYCILHMPKYFTIFGICLHILLYFCIGLHILLYFCIQLTFFVICLVFCQLGQFRDILVFGICSIVESMVGKHVLFIFKFYFLYSNFAMCFLITSPCFSLWCESVFLFHVFPIKATHTSQRDQKRTASFRPLYLDI